MVCLRSIKIVMQRNSMEFNAVLLAAMMAGQPVEPQNVQNHHEHVIVHVQLPPKTGKKDIGKKIEIGTAFKPFQPIRFKQRMRGAGKALSKRAQKRNQK